MLFRKRRPDDFSELRARVESLESRFHAFEARQLRVEAMLTDIQREMRKGFAAAQAERERIAVQFRGDK